MSTSVKISREGKRLLDKLQARIVIATGRKFSQQELWENLVRLSAEREDELISYLAGISLPLLPGEVETLMKLPRIGESTQAKKRSTYSCMVGERASQDERLRRHGRLCSLL